MQSYSAYCVRVAVAFPAFSELTSSEGLLIDRCWTGTKMDSSVTVVYHSDHTLRTQQVPLVTHSAALVRGDSSEISFRSDTNFGWTDLLCRLRVGVR